ADVNDFRGLFAQDVDAEELHVIGTKKQFQKAGTVADDLAAGIGRVGRLTGHIGDTLGGQAFLGFAGHGTLGDGVNAIGEDPRQPLAVFQIEGVDHGNAGLLHRGGGQGRVADDVPGGIDVGNAGLVILIDVDPAAGIDPAVDALQAEKFR